MPQTTTKDNQTRLKSVTTETGRLILYDTTDARKRISSAKTLPVKR